MDTEQLDKELSVWRIAQQIDITLPGFIKKNRDVARAFFQISDELRRAGHKHYSARGVTEVIRWKTAVSENSPTFKINNNHSAKLARLYNAVRGVDFFKTRERHH